MNLGGFFAEVKASRAALLAVHSKCTESPAAWLLFPYCPSSGGAEGQAQLPFSYFWELRSAVSVERGEK